MSNVAVAPWSPPPTLNPAVFYDLFPTEVIFPATNSTYSKARIILTAPPSPRFYVFTDGPQGPGAAVIAEYDPALLFGNTAEGFNIVLTAPNPTPILVTARPMTGCGCGTAVKGFLPFSTMRHTTPPPSAGSLADYATHPGVPQLTPA